MERKDVTDIANFHVERINQAHQRLDEHDNRLKSVETHVAVSAERDRHIQNSLGKLESGQTWLIRLVIGGIVMGAIAFLIAGGFNVGK